MKITCGFWEVISVATVSLLASAELGDGLAGACLVTLWLAFKLLATGDGIPILFLAVAFQWMQVSIGVFYSPMFARPLNTMVESDYRPMVMIGLGCVLALAAGLRGGVALVRGGHVPVAADTWPMPFRTWPTLVVLYVASIFLQGTLVQLSGAYPSLRQILVTATVIRYVLLFLILRRLAMPTLRLGGFAALLVVEVALGFTTYFAGFREPLVFGMIVLMETFDRRNSRHWLALGGMVTVMIGAGVIWTGVRAQYRHDFDSIETFSTSQRTRLNRVSELGSDFLKQDSGDMFRSVDQMVDRLWVVYYPALAVTRVPAVLPYTDGSILWAAIEHIFTPRILFPDKAELPSDSDMVRKYSGVMVAGREKNTSIAFGYAAESYVDFGLPGMFVPVFGFGLAMGAIYAWFLRAISCREVAVSFVTVAFWLGLYLFERSWANNLGNAVSIFVYLGLPLVLLDRFLVDKSVREEPDELFARDRSAGAAWSEHV